MYTWQDGSGFFQDPFLITATVAIRLWGSASVVVLTGIDPRPVAVKKRLLHWGLSLVAAAFAMTLAPLVANL